MGKSCRLPLGVARMARAALAPLTLIAASMAALMGCGDSAPRVPQASQQYIAARDFLAKGQTDQALEALNASIDSEPTTWALLERGRLHAQLGNDAAAREDCEAGLALEPGDPDLLWLRAELKKPPAERFKGKFKLPPSASRN